MNADEEEADDLPEAAGPLTGPVVEERSPRDVFERVVESPKAIPGVVLPATWAAHRPTRSSLAFEGCGATKGVHVSVFLMRSATFIISPHWVLICFFSSGFDDSLSAFIRFSATLMARVSASSLVAAV